jgi:hypothetical protein
MDSDQTWAYWPFPRAMLANLLEDPPKWEAWQRQMAEQAAAGGWVLGEFQGSRDIGTNLLTGEPTKAVVLMWAATPVPEVLVSTPDRSR